MSIPMIEDRMSMYNDSHLRKLFIHNGGKKKHEEMFISAVQRLIDDGYRLEQKVNKKSSLDKDGSNKSDSKYSDLKNMRFFVFSHNFPDVDEVVELSDGSITFFVYDGSRIIELTIRLQMKRGCSYWVNKDEFWVWYDVICDRLPMLNPQAWINKSLVIK